MVASSRAVVHGLTSVEEVTFDPRQDGPGATSRTMSDAREQRKSATDGGCAWLPHRPAWARPDRYVEGGDNLVTMGHRWRGLTARCRSKVPSAVSCPEATMTVERQERGRADLDGRRYRITPTY